MTIICAWCKKALGEKEPLEDKSISHTICPGCKEMIKGKLTEAGEEDKSNPPNLFKVGTQRCPDWT